MKKICSIVLVLGLFLSMTTLSFASADNYEMSDAEGMAARLEYIDNKIEELGAQGPEAVDKWLAENGVVKLDSFPDDQGIQPSSTGSDITINKLSAYYDTDTHKYIFKGWWNWDSISAFDQKTGSADKVAIAIYTSTGFNSVSSLNIADGVGGISVYDQNGNSYRDNGYVSHVDGSGAVFDCVDKYDGPFNRCIGYKGQAWVWADNIAPGTYKLALSYAHSYNQCAINSFSIGWSGSSPTVRVDFSDANNGWTQADLINFSI